MERDGPGTTDAWLGVFRERERPTQEYSHEIRVHSVPSDFSDGARPKWDEALAGRRGRREEGQGPAAASLRRRRCCVGGRRTGVWERMGGRRMGARELEDGGTQRGEHVASRARAAASRASSWASASTPPRWPPSADASWASAAASWARGELGGRRHGASSGEGGTGRARWGSQAPAEETRWAVGIEEIRRGKRKEEKIKKNCQVGPTYQ